MKVKSVVSDITSFSKFIDGRRRSLKKNLKTLHPNPSTSSVILVVFHRQLTDSALSLTFGSTSKPRNHPSDGAASKQLVVLSSLKTKAAEQPLFEVLAE